jgi:tripartite-type tricarboxylate transporter receptor subunit TctC
MKIFAWTLTVAAIGMAAPLNAQNLPKQIRIIVPYSAGGGTDIIARNLAEKSQAFTDSTLIVENKPGAYGIIGTEIVAKAPADGSNYVLVVKSHLLNPIVVPKMPYDTLKDLRPVTEVATSPLVLVANVNIPGDNLVEVSANNKGRKFSYGSSENMTRLVGNMMTASMKLDAVHIPYKGGGPMMTDIAGGSLDMGVTSVLTAKALIDAGKIKAIAMSGTERSPILPNTPTMKEMGINGFENIQTSYALYTSAKTPDAVVNQFYNLVDKALQTEGMQKVLRDQAAQPSKYSIKQFEEFFKQDYALWTGLAKKYDLKGE